MAAEPTSGAGESLGHRLRRAVAVGDWLAGYQRAWLGHDLIAGLTLAAYAVPVSLAYGSLAGLPPQMGLYGFLWGSVYAFFGTSRQLSIGPSSSISLLIGSVIGGMVASDGEHAAQLASAAALLVGAIAVTALVLRLGHIVNFISETVLLGFKVGAALVIASTQLPALFGLASSRGDILTQLTHVVASFDRLNPVALATGLGAILVMLAGERWLRGWPVALLVVIGSIVGMQMLDPGGHSLPVVGHIAGGVPLPGLPALHWKDLDALLPVALAAFLLSHVEGISVARTFGLTHRYRIDVNQELLAIGAANVAVGFGHGYPVAGGMSQSAVNDGGGARTPASILFSSLVLAVVLIFFTDAFRSLPQAVLAAIVMVSVKGLINVGELRQLRIISRPEFRLAMIALVGVLVFGILRGVVAAAVISLVSLIGRVEFPPLYVLGRLPGTNRYRSVENHPEAELLPGVLVFRVDAELVYFNVENIRSEVLRLVDRQQQRLDLLVFDLSGVSDVDLAAVRMLASLFDELRERGVGFELAEARHSVRGIMLAAGLQSRFGPLDHRASVADVVDGRMGERDPGRPRSA